MYFLISFLFFLSSIAFYILYRWWNTGRQDEKTYSKEMTRLGTVRAYVYIILLILLSIVFLLKGI